MRERADGAGGGDVFFDGVCAGRFDFRAAYLFSRSLPKKRHHKRRLIQEKFMPVVQRILRSGGRLQIVTDHAEYFEQIEPVVRASQLQVVDYNRPGSAGEG